MPNGEVGSRRTVSTTTTSVHFLRPRDWRRVHRSPVDAAAVWRSRLPRYLWMALGWAVVTVASATRAEATAAVVLSAAACVLSLAVCVKAIVIIRRGAATE